MAGHRLAALEGGGGGTSPSGVVWVTRWCGSQTDTQAQQNKILISGTTGAFRSGKSAMISSPRYWAAAVVEFLQRNLSAPLPHIGRGLINTSLPAAHRTGSARFGHAAGAGWRRPAKEGARAGQRAQQPRPQTPAAHNPRPLHRQSTGSQGYPARGPRGCVACTRHPTGRVCKGPKPGERGLTCLRATPLPPRAFAWRRGTGHGGSCAVASAVSGG